nr:ABC transporter permease subunit [Roseibium aquae]
MKTGLGAGSPKLPTLLLFVLLAGPISAGLLGTLLPAFGYLPALGASDPSPDAFRALFSAPGIWTSIALSLGTGLVATALSLGIVILFTAGWSSTRAFDNLRRFLSPLLSVPHAAAAFGLAFLIAPSGFLVRLVSPALSGWERPPDLLILNDPYGLTMTAGLILKEVPFLFLMTVAALTQVNVKSISRAVASLGYGRMRGFLITAAPQVYPQIRLPVLAVLAYSTSVVDVALILGPTTPAPLAPRILVWLSDPDPAMRLKASAGAVLQIAVSALAILIWLGFERLARNWFFRTSRTGRRQASDRVPRFLVLTFVIILVAVTASGFGLLGLWSVARGWWFPDTFPAQLTLATWREALTTGGTTIWTTFVLGAGSAICCAALVIWLLESHTRAGNVPGNRLRQFLFLPLLVPQVSFLFGLQVLFIHAQIDGTLLAVMLAHSVFVLPYVFLALADPWAHQDPRYARIAATLGATNSRIFRKVRLPMLLTPLLVAIAIGFAVSVGQYLPTVLIGSGRVSTVTTESLALAAGGNRSLLGVYAMLQLILPFIVFSLASLIPALVFRNRLGMRPTSTH